MIEAAGREREAAIGVPDPCGVAAVSFGLIEGVIGLREEDFGRDEVGVGVGVVRHWDRERSIGGWRAIVWRHGPEGGAEESSSRGEIAGVEDACGIEGDLRLVGDGRGDADAHGDPAGLVVDENGVASQALAESFRDPHGGMDRAIGGEDGEFLSTESRGEVMGAHGEVQDAGDVAEDAVAVDVSQLVVDCLEMVEVDHEDREVLACAEAPAPLGLEAGGEGVAIGETCEGIDVGACFQAVDECLILERELDAGEEFGTFDGMDQVIGRAGVEDRGPVIRACGGATDDDRELPGRSAITDAVQGIEGESGLGRDIRDDEVGGKILQTVGEIVEGGGLDATVSRGDQVSRESIGRCLFRRDDEELFSIRVG
jgi:hypothetical protein